MKKTILILSLFITHFSYTYGQHWLWAKGVVNKDTLSFSDPYGIARDNSGNVFETGTCGGTTIFGSDTVVCMSKNDGDIFLAKFDPSGNTIWVKTPKANSDSAHGWYYGVDVTSDAAGNAYITGGFGDTIQFGVTTLTTIDTGYGAGLLPYLVKYDANGNVLWAKSAAPKNYANGVGYGTRVDGLGNVYMVGRYSGNLKFGTNSLYVSSTQGTVFLVKYDTSGNPLWARGMSIATDNFSYSGSSSIVTDKTGNVYISGYYRGDSVGFGTTFLPATFGDNVFFAKFSPLGNLIWIKTAVPAYSGRFSNSVSQATVMTTDASGNIYIGGGFTDSISFGGHTVLNKRANGGLFLVKYDTAGNVIWAKYGTSGNFSFSSFVCSVSADNINHNIYLSGDYWDTLSFGSDTMKSTTVYPSFILKFDTLGNVLCGTSIDNDNDDFNGVVADPTTNSVYFNGDVYGPIDSTYYCTFGTTVLSGTGLEYGFMAKWTCSPAGINELNNKPGEISVYPNPSHGVFTIVQSAEKQSERIEVYNILGEKIYSNLFLIPNSQFLIDLSNRPNGIYLYRILTESGNLVGEGKLIKE